MKILLATPPICQENIYGYYSSGSPNLPPLGLCYIASFLKKHKKDSEVRIIDCLAENITLQELKKQIKQYCPQIIGVSATTVSYIYSKNVFDIAKEVNKKIVTALGGAHVSSRKEECLQECEKLDIGVIGEGEKTFYELVESIENKKDLKNVKGIVFRKDGEIITTPSRDLEKNLDNFPIPARELLKDLSLYSHSPMRGSKYSTTQMITSRGCVFSCTFCEQSVFRRTWRGHSSNYVIEEIKNLIANFGIKFISFEDDNFIISKKRAVEICEGIIKNRLDIQWGCSCRVDGLESKLLKLMKEAGCRDIYCGIESASKRIKKLYNKNINNEKVKEGVRLINEAGLRAYGSFILGGPTETREEIQSTISFSKFLPLDGASFFLFVPYPNSKIRELAMQSGYVSNNWADYSAHNERLAFIPNGFTEEELIGIRNKASMAFLLRPKFLLKNWKVLFTFDFICKAFGFILKILRRKSTSGC